MRGKNRRYKNYFDRNRNNIEEWVNPTQTNNYRGRNNQKFGRGQNKDENYQYIQKERNRYSKKELVDLAPEFKIDNDILEDLCKNFDELFSNEKREPLELGIEDNEDTFIYNPDRPKKYNNNYSKGGRGKYEFKNNRKKSFNSKKELKKFDNFLGEELPENFYENADKLLEQRYYASKNEDDSLPAWATEDYDEDIPLWGDVDTEEVKKDTENAHEWSENYIKTLDKNEIAKEIEEGEEADFNKIDEDGNAIGTQKEFTQEEINNLPNLLEAMQQEWIEEAEMKKAEVHQEKPAPQQQQQDIPAVNENNGEKAFDNLLSIFAGSENVRVIGTDGEENEEQASESSESEDAVPASNNQNPKFSNMFSQVKTGSQFGNFAGLDAFIKNDDEEDDDNDDEDEAEDEENIPITSMVAGPPPPVVPKDEPEEEDIEKQQSKREFQEKYFVMDKVLSQVVYDALNSKRRRAINLHSVNGINQMSAEKFCANNYKIFSFLMQGDIFSKVWFYKDKLGNVQGPFMSFDMDIWNGEGNYFAKSLQISPNNKDYHPLRKYINRDPAVLELMQETVTQQEQKLENPMMMRMMMPPRNQQQLNPFGFLPPNQFPPQMMKIPNKKMNQKMHKSRSPYGVPYMLNPRNMKPLNVQIPKKGGRMMPPKMAPVYMYNPQMMPMGKTIPNTSQNTVSSPLLPQTIQKTNVIMNLNNLGTAATEQTQNLKDLLGIGAPNATNPLEGLLGPSIDTRQNLLRKNIQPTPIQQLRHIDGKDFPSLGETFQKR